MPQSRIMYFLILKSNKIEILMINWSRSFYKSFSNLLSTKNCQIFIKKSTLTGQKCFPTIVTPKNSAPDSYLIFHSYSLILNRSVQIFWIYYGWFFPNHWLWNFVRVLICRLLVTMAEHRKQLYHNFFSFTWYPPKHLCQTIFFYWIWNNAENQFKDDHVRYSFMIPFLVKFCKNNLKQNTNDLQ